MELALCTAATAVLSMAALATSADAQAKSPLGVSAEIGVVSDYRFRGVSYSNGKPALQGGFTVEHASGFYLGTWASSIAETAGGARAEVDWLAGYATTMGSKLNLDASVAYYSYPSDGSPNFAEGIATVSYVMGRLTPKLGVSYAPKQKNLRDEFGAKRDNVHSFAGADLELAGTPLTLSAQLGYERGPFDLVDGGGKWDWRIGGTANVRGIDLGLTYVDSNARFEHKGENLAGSALVASALLSW